MMQLLRDRHVMVRVGGGWDTLEHFLGRHGADLDGMPPEISPSDLLPMDTRPSESRRRSSVTTIVSPVAMNGGQQIMSQNINTSSQLLLNTSNTSSATTSCQVSPSINSITSDTTHLKITTVHTPVTVNNSNMTPTKMTTPTKSSAKKSPMYRSPSTSHLPVLRRCLSSTPVNSNRQLSYSRRSSIASSSPEPWGQMIMMQSGSGNHSNSTSNSNLSTISGYTNGSKIPKRYINYLSSSQHISSSSRQSLSGSTMALVSSTPDRPTNSSSSSSSSPDKSASSAALSASVSTQNTNGKTKIPSPQNRRASLKAF